MKPHLLSGRAEGLPYSLSRWTDVPAAKWRWFVETLKSGSMTAIDPRSGIPLLWSLAPEETLGLVFWTKDPRNILYDWPLLKPYKVQVHVTMTDWHEVEIGAPRVIEDRIFAYASMLIPRIPAEHVFWRFSPVPLVPDVVARFERLAKALAGHGPFRRVYLSFLQENDQLPETRTAEERVLLMAEMAEVAAKYNLEIRLCNEDRTLHRINGLPKNLCAGVCAAPEDWELPGMARPPSEGCGCVLMADPFTINESCTMGCRYCYAADKSLAEKKRNTTKGHLKVVR